MQKPLSNVIIDIQRDWHVFDFLPDSNNLQFVCVSHASSSLKFTYFLPLSASECSSTWESGVCLCVCSSRLCLFAMHFRTKHTYRMEVEFCHKLRHLWTFHRGGDNSACIQKLVPTDFSFCFVFFSRDSRWLFCFRGWMNGSVFLRRNCYPWTLGSKSGWLPPTTIWEGRSWGRKWLASENNGSQHSPGQTKCGGSGEEDHFMLFSSD